MRAAFYVWPASKRTRSGDASRGVRLARIYNAAMNKPASRRHLRRTALWVAFAALAGFLLADLT